MLFHQQTIEEAVTLTNRQGARLYGILHVPNRREPLNGARHGVHILNPGLKNRVAPNRLNVKVARTLCNAGLPVLRSDPRGIGDSEGRIGSGNASVFDLWLKIQQGALVEDTIAWNDFFHRRAGLDGLTLVGQCGAGVTALLAAARDKRVNRLVLIDTPFRKVATCQGGHLIAEDYASSEDILREGVTSVLQWAKLKKLLTFRVNGRLYLRALASWLRQRLPGRPPGKQLSLHERFNHPMAEAFRVLMKRSAQVCFLYAENDFSVKEFSSDFQPNFLEGDNGAMERCALHIIPNANHIYTEIDWQQDLIGHIRRWMVRPTGTMDSSGLSAS